MKYISAVKQHIMYNNLPEFMYISGSFALEQLLISNLSKDNMVGRSGIDWSCGDCDIFIDTTHDMYNPEEMLTYCVQLLNTELNSSTKQTIYSNISEIYSYAANILIDMRLCKISDILLPGERNTDAVRYAAGRVGNNINGMVHPYIASSNNIIKVFKIDFGNGDFKVDFIFIDVNIESYLINNFDMSVVRNYINSYGELISLNDVSETMNMVSSYSYNLFMDRINRYVRANTVNLIKRIIKYESRGFKIYIKPDWLDCECEESNCLCSIRFNIDFVKFFAVGALIVPAVENQDNNRYYRFARCCLENGHEDKCVSRFHYDSINSMNRNIHVDEDDCRCRNCLNSRPAGSKICGHYVLPSYFTKYIAAFEMDIETISTKLYGYYLGAYEQIFKKYVMQRELVLNYAMHPSNILKLHDFELHEF